MVKTRSVFFINNLSCVYKEQSVHLCSLYCKLFGGQRRVDKLSMFFTECLIPHVTKSDLLQLDSTTRCTAFINILKVKCVFLSFKIQETLHYNKIRPKSTDTK